MTREEAIKKLADIIFDVSELGDIPYYTEDEQCAMNIARRRIDELFPPLPDNLDEVAEKYANKEFPNEPAVGQWGTGDYEPPIDMEYPREIAKDAFKAGAEWMSKQEEKAKWKPSEEQMNALKEASVSWMNKEMGNCELLESLYNDLKKL